MPILEELPDDDAFRVVKWVDKFTLPHLTTRSASVCLRLQRLPLRRHADLNRLSREDAVALLRLDRTDTAQSQYTSVAVHTGLLPHLVIGRVYQGQRLVGELPTRQATISLPHAELSCREVSIGEELEAPPGWAYPYKQLLSREYGGIQTEFSASRCLVFHDKSGIDYVIPRALIFQRFYAIQRELANAFTSGPWAKTKDKIVYEGCLTSGLQTKIDPTTGAWHIILQTHVENDFARLAALLYFDEYAKACAESIYAGMLADRRGPHAPWFAQAKIPFRAEAKPLRLQIKGFMLAPRLGRSSPGGKPVVHKQSFLVTSIMGCSWPSYTPKIKASRLNSGDKGIEQLPADGDGPYTGQPGARPAGSDMTTTSAVDASATQGDAITLEDTFSWLDGEEPEKLTKDRSQLYGGSDIRRPQPPPPSTASGGERTHQSGNAAPAHHRILVRDPVNRFSYLLEAFEALQKTQDLRSYSVYQPAVASQMAQCGGLVCWNFLDAVARRTGRWPNAGWRMIERARGRGSERTPGKPRCVLVVRVERAGGVGYWFEIETRPTEGGVLSPYFYELGQDDQEVIQHLIESIARAEGRNLRQSAKTALEATGHGNAQCYRHYYRGEQSSKLDVNSLRRFFARCDS